MGAQTSDTPARPEVETVLESAPPEDWGSRARFARLSQAVRDLSVARSHDEIIEVTRRAAREIAGSMGVAIVLRDGDECHYIAEDSEIPLWTGQRFPAEACISGWAMLNRRQAVVPDIYADSRIPHLAYRPTGIHSLIMTPVGEPEPFAALGAYWREVRHPSEDEIAAMTALASCMGATLQNLKLLDSLRAEADHRQLLIHELNHRVKNTLAIVQGISAQSLRGDPALDSVREEFDGRLAALANTHVLMTDAEWRPVDLADLLQTTTRPFAEGAAARFLFEGPVVRLQPKSAVTFSLAIHELCTNASKYGALSADGGQVSVNWMLHGQDAPRLKLVWCERGGPPVTLPEKRGFGSRLLERGLAHELNGRVELRFETAGVVCEIDAPLPDDEEAAPLTLPR